MNKKDLNSQLENAKNNYILGMAAISLLSNEKAYPLLKESGLILGKYEIGFKQVANLLSNHSDRDIALKEYLNSHIRALSKESFELIKNYCIESDQLSILKSASWYQFARLIRNCISHNFKFVFNEYDKGILPVSWKNRTIETNFNGKYLELKFFGYVETWELFVEYQDLVNNYLE